LPSGATRGKPTGTVEALAAADGEWRYNAVTLFERANVGSDLYHLASKFVAHDESRSRGLVASEDVEFTAEQSEIHGAICL
jgi:hypothetical protein